MDKLMQFMTKSHTIEEIETIMNQMNGEFVTSIHAAEIMVRQDIKGKKLPHKTQPEYIQILVIVDGFMYTMEGSVAGKSIIITKIDTYNLYDLI